MSFGTNKGIPLGTYFEIVLCLLTQNLKQLLPWYNSYSDSSNNLLG